MIDYEKLRKRMVEEQLIPRGITHRDVLDVFYRVPRHEFVPSELKDASYADHPLPIGDGQTISQPYMVALMTECLKLTHKERVLEIGTGSGYQAAILAGLAKEVYSIERFSSLADRAKDTLRRLGYDNIEIKIGDGSLGWEEHSPYDGIIVTCAAPDIPDSYIKQLKNGGRIVIPIGSIYSQVLTVVEKKDNTIYKNEICGCVFVPLVGIEGWKG